MQDKNTPSTDQAEWTPEDIRRMLSNPYYCIRIHPRFCGEHDFLISEDHFIKAALKIIEQSGAESYLRGLLANLKGDSV